MSSWFPYNRFLSPPEARLFCFAHSGGVASIFRSWQNYFPPSVEVCPVQLPGRETRFSDPLIFSMDELVKKLVPQILPLSNLPIAFFGHSLGALIAFELAKKIKEIHPSQELSVFLSACCAPDRLRHLTKLHLLPEEAFVKELASYGAMPRALLENKDALRVLLPRLRADFSIFETYCPIACTIDAPILAFGGLEDDLVPLEDLKAWERYTAKSFSSYFFPGGHFYYLEASMALCNKIEKALMSKMPV